MSRYGDTQPDPRFNQIGNAFLGGIQQSQDNQRQNAMLDMDRQQFGMQQRNQAMREDEYARGIAGEEQAAQKSGFEEQLGILSLKAARGDAQAGAQVLEALGLDPNDADGPELFGALAEKYGGFKLGGGNQSDPYTLAPGSRRYGADNKLINETPFAPPNQTVIQLPAGQAAFNPRTGKYDLLSDREDQRKEDSDDEAAKTEARLVAEFSHKAATELPKVRQNASSMVTLVNDFVSHPGFEWVYGARSMAPVVPGTPQADAVGMWEQVHGKAFLEAFQSLKGGGPITDTEGKAATSAMTRLANRKISPAAARKAAQELIEITEAVLARAEQAGQGSGGGPNASGEYEVGKVYKDAKGNRAKFLGDGKWEQL